MVPIYLHKNGGKDYDFNGFRQEFLAICRNHQQQNRALAFAFILYDFNHPEIRKVLADEHYWDALNYISGSSLTVFSFHLDKKHRGGPGSSASQAFAGSQQFVGKQFGIELPRERPTMLFFQVTGDQVLTPCVLEVRAKTVEDAFNEIHATLLDAVDSVKDVQPKYRQDSAAVFDLIYYRLMQRKTFLVIKTVLKLAGSAQEFVGKLHGL